MTAYSQASTRRRVFSRWQHPHCRPLTTKSMDCTHLMKRELVQTRGSVSASSHIARRCCRTLRSNSHRRNTSMPYTRLAWKKKENAKGYSISVHENFELKKRILDKGQASTKCTSWQVHHHENSLTAQKQAAKVRHYNLELVSYGGVAYSS